MILSRLYLSKYLTVFETVICVVTIIDEDEKKMIISMLVAHISIIYLISNCCAQVLLSLGAWYTDVNSMDRNIFLRGAYIIILVVGRQSITK